jgi:hypothetical protein
MTGPFLCIYVAFGAKEKKEEKKNQVLKNKHRKETHDEQHQYTNQVLRFHHGIAFLTSCAGKSLEMFSKSSGGG